MNTTNATPTVPGEPAQPIRPSLNATTKRGFSLIFEILNRGSGGRGVFEDQHWINGYQFKRTARQRRELHKALSFMLYHANFQMDRDERRVAAKSQRQSGRLARQGE